MFGFLVSRYIRAARIATNIIAASHILEIKILNLVYQLE